MSKVLYDQRTATSFMGWQVVIITTKWARNEYGAPKDEMTYHDWLRYDYVHVFG